MANTCQKLFLAFSLLLTIGFGSAQAAPSSDPLAGPQTPFLVTNGQVNAIVRSGNSIFVGGAFTRVRYYSGNGVALAVSNGAEDKTYPRVNGSIFAVISDGSGGWYIGGSFTNVGGLTRNSVAHIKADKTVDANWDPNVSGEVRALIKDGNTIYLGGDFDRVGNPQQIRNRLAAVNATTGALLTFNPDCKDTIRAMTLSDDGSLLYVGGEFHLQADPLAPSCGGQVRNYIAAIKTSDGTATSWDPNADSAVRALVLSGNSLYVGGDFQNIAGVARNRIAELNKDTGVATSWDPNAQQSGAGGSVRALAVSGSLVYVGGSFTKIGSQNPQPTRNRIAALNVSNGNATTWDPNASSTVESIVVAGSLVYVGGAFSSTVNVPNSIGGQPRNNIAALNVSNGTATAWDPNLNAPILNSGTVHALVLAGSTVYAGGEFDSAGGETLRNNLAAFDAITGAVLPFNPNVNGTVHALATIGNTLYFGGEFTAIGALVRNRIASMDISGAGTLTNWTPNANGIVRALAVANGAGAIYVGGEFTNIAGVGRNRLAALNVSAPVQATGWNPNADNTVFTLVPAAPSSGDKVYAGGAFTTIGGLDHPRVVFLKGSGSTSALALAWNPRPNGTVRTMLVGQPIVCQTPSDPAKPTLTTPVYLGGDFTCLIGNADPTLPCGGSNGFGRDHLAAVKNTSSQDNAQICNWNPGANNTVRALAQSGNTIFAGGDFTLIGLGVARNRVAALDNISGSALSFIAGEPGGGVSWNPNANNSVNVLVASDVPSPGRLYVGGAFSTIAGAAPIGLPRYNLAAFSYAPLVTAIAPVSRSVQVGTTATAFALFVNADNTQTATQVGIAPNGFIAPSDFYYYAYSPVTAPPNTPVDIPPGGIQVYVIALTPGSPLNPSQIPFVYEGSNTNAAPFVNSVNTMLFSAADTPTLDIISSIITDTNDGILTLPSAGSKFMVAASINVASIGGTMTVEANTGSVTLPLTLSLCQTSSGTTSCQNPPSLGPSATLTVTGGEFDSYVILAEASGPIPFDPGVNRIFLNFHEGPTITGPVRGLTSVAVRTQ